MPHRTGNRNTNATVEATTHPWPALNLANDGERHEAHNRDWWSTSFGRGIHADTCPRTNHVECYRESRRAA